ncbi:hypothetical protein [Streptosporangium sp. NPDC001681]|uniref:hypothetical protein n=1 Tax=Streptosporangium sp. NPDC001681 TaxID=3154395 RepID=UPI00332A9C33
MKPLILLGAIALVVACIVLTKWLDTRARGVRADRRALRRHEELVDEVYRMALDAASIDRSAHLIAEKIRASTPSRKAGR